MNFGALAQQAQGLIGGDSAGSGGGGFGDLIGGLGGGGGAPKGDTMQMLMTKAKGFLADRKGATDDPEVAGDGTVEGDLAALKAAMKGIGTDEDKMVNIIFRRPREHLQKLEEADSFLMTRIKMETSGNLQECIEYAFQTPAECRAGCLYRAMKSRGTDEEAVIDCLCSCTPSEVVAAREAYKKNGISTHIIQLDFRVKFETSGQLQRCFEAVMAEGRPESGINEPALEGDVELFHRATEGKLGTDERALSDLVAQRSRDHIRALNAAYNTKYGKTAFDVVRDECSGDVKLALMATMMPIECWIAYRIHDAIAGIGTDEESLIRNIMIPKQEELRNAAIVMQEVYGENMIDRVSSELSGALKDCIGTYLSYCITGK